MLVVVAWIVHRVWSGLFIPWWFNTDEVAFYYEMIRQLRLDFSQTFFDIPGTPYTTLTSLLTFFWWAGERLVGCTTAVNPSDFAFEHVQSVYTLMRSLTLGCYVGAVGLAYDIFRRAAGPLTATVAAILFATLPIHVQYSHFVRTESLGLVLCLSSVWLLLHPRLRRQWLTYLTAGVLAGIAMGARYHFALVGLPVLLTLYFFEDRPALDLAGPGTPRRALYGTGAALAAIFIIGGLITLLLKIGVLGPGLLTHSMLLTTAAGPDQYAAAKHGIAKLWLLLAAVSAVTLALHGFAAGRKWLRPFVNSFVLSIVLGFAAGFLFSHPEFLWRGEYQLRSIQFYSDWVAPSQQALGYFESWWNVTRYYFTTALPERGIQMLFFVGVILTLWRRNPVHGAFLIGAVCCFVAHPLTMKMWPHHIIPWLPFLCFVAACPIGWLAAWGTRRIAYPLLPVVVVPAVAVILTWALLPRIDKADEYWKVSLARTEQITEMSGWLTEHMPPNAYLLLSYYSLNDDGFLKWIESSGVRVPDQVKKHRDVQIWWLDRAAIDGHEGYVCVSGADIAFFHDDFERRSPGSTYNPFDDKRFQLVATFGGGFYQIQVFKFDFRQPRVGG